MKKKPLVTICIPNYNYGKYLPYCLDSILNQTYSNIEVHFRDNASTDGSYEIAQEYRKKFKERGIYFEVAENKRNLGSDKNSKLATGMSEGEFLYTLASDDAINPQFLERCIDVFERYPNVGTVMVNREEIDDNNTVTKLPPFYNGSYVIDGEAQAAVHMMAGIAIPGQRMVRRTVLNIAGAYGRLWNVAGDWYDNFVYACVADVAYVAEDLMQYRVHRTNETNESERKLLGITEHYQLLDAFLNVAQSMGIRKPAERYKEAVEHLGDMCLRYALKMIKDQQYIPAKKYLELAPILKEGIADTGKYSRLTAMLEYRDAALLDAVESYEKEYDLNRKVSYDPPAESYPLELH